MGEVGSAYRAERTDGGIKESEWLPDTGWTTTFRPGVGGGQRLTAGYNGMGAPFGAGMLTRALSPAAMQAMAAQKLLAMGGASPEQSMAAAMLNRQGRGAYGAATATGGGMGGLAMASNNLAAAAPGVAQQIAGAASAGQRGAVGGYMSNLFQNQTLNDQAALAREKMLADLLLTRTTGELHSSELASKYAMDLLGAGAGALGAGIAGIANSGYSDADANSYLATYGQGGGYRDPAFGGDGGGGS